ncbi:MAG: DUF1579 domain-containing protein [bacterium]|nr:DUF1579 domain-containing protein [bacterium]
MNSSWRQTFIVGSCLFLLLGISGAQADDKKPAKKEPAAEADAAAAGQPGPEHKQLARMVGVWDCATTAYYNPKEPVAGKGTAKFTMIMGGRFLQQEFQGETSGEKYQGRGLTGYDRTHKKFVGSWIDSMSTGLMVTSGAYDEKSHALVEYGIAQMPTGKVKMKLVSEYESNDKFTFSMYALQDDEVVKMMEIVYTRAKKKD